MCGAHDRRLSAGVTQDLHLWDWPFLRERWLKAGAKILQRRDVSLAPIPAEFSTIAAVRAARMPAPAPTMAITARAAGMERSRRITVSRQED